MSLCTASYEMHVWTTGWFPRRLMITCTWRVLFQLEASSWLIDNFNGRWHVQPIKGQFWRESRRWMKWATSHMEAWSSLRSNKSSNHHGRPMIGTALTSKWKASTRMSQCIERIKKALNNKQRHHVMMEHWRGGTYMSNQVRMHACHLTSKHCIYFWSVAGKILNVVQQDWGQRKIVDLKNNKESWFWPWNGRKMR